MIRISGQNHPGLWWALNPVTVIIIRKEGDTQIHRVEHHEKMETKIEIIYLQTKDCQRLLATTRSLERGMKLRASRKNQHY